MITVGKEVVEIFGDLPCYRDYVLLLGYFFENVFHFSFEFEPVVEDEVGLSKGDRVAAGGLIEVRVDSFPDESGDFHLFATNDTHYVSDHACSDGDWDGVLRRGGDFRLFCFTAGTEK